MLITSEELIRGASIAIFGGLAGTCTVALPGSVIWTLPAACAVIGAALASPDVRREVVQALPVATQERLGRAMPTLAAPTYPDTGSGSPSELGVLPVATSAAPSGGALDHQPLDHQPLDLMAALNEAAHRLIIGHTGGGKTTLIHHLATQWATGARVVVCDPDAAPGQWPGCTVAGYGDDYAAIAAQLDQIRATIDERRAQRGRGVRTFPALHLVIDEAQDVLRECTGALALIEDVIRRGRKLSVHATVGVQDSQVKTLGLEGKSHLLTNLLRVEVMPAAGGRVAKLPGGIVTLPTLPSPETFIAHMPATGADSLLGALLALPVPDTTPNAGNNPVTALERDVPDVTALPDPDVTPTEAAIIARLLATGVTPSEIAKRLPKYSPRHYRAYRAKVDQVQALLETR